MKQESKEIEISKLHLWTENPRDPVDSNMKDVDIILRAINQKDDKWELKKLIQQMGDYYDCSEIPTVVEQDGKYIVYDGNRRVAIIKYAQHPEWSRQVEADLFSSDIPPAFKGMHTIPCNVCDETTALTNIERKHINSGTWGELERSYFLHTHRGESKDNLLIIEEDVGGIISNNTKLNQRFIREEIFTDENLEKIGFKISNEKLLTNYDPEKAKLVLDNILDLVKSGKISTRGKYRGKLFEPLEEYFPDLKLQYFDDKKNNEVQNMDLDYGGAKNNNQIRKTPRTQNNTPPVFGHPLGLKAGDVNDLYRDIDALYRYYSKNKNDLSDAFPALIRMALRLLVECAARELEMDISTYIRQNFDEAKITLNHDHKTRLHTQNVKKENIESLLHIGAHDYTVSKNIEQTVAMSLIIGAMLTISHPR